VTIPATSLSRTILLYPAKALSTISALTSPLRGELATAYAAIYVALLLVVSCWIFRKRNLK